MMAGPPSESGASQEPTRIEGPPSDTHRPTEPERGSPASSNEGTTTDFAPPFRPMVIGARRASPSGLSGLPDPGQRLDDFEILQILGEGSFGRVYLAKQISLGRQVALKVLANRGNEARTLASLEHDHIIRVHAETVRGHLRLLCMQYVPGTNLEAILQFLARVSSGPVAHEEKAARPVWDGRTFLKAIDQLSTQPAALEPAFLRDREFLGASDFVEVVCWIGGRLAEALDHAHRQGILHRDIKPDNILFNRYGRPMLADFSLACTTVPVLEEGSEEESDPPVFGGTLAYMSPEHLDAFLSRDHSARQAVDERSDLYSLGVVLFEFLTGKLPHPSGRGAKGEAGEDTLGTLAAQRRSRAPSPRRENPRVPAMLDRTTRRCLTPQPEERYQTAAELAHALEGCRQLRRVEKELPSRGPITRAAEKHPFIILILLALLPNILGSGVNISYNFIRIVNDLERSQQDLFNVLLIGYNAVAYAICLAVGIWLLAPIMRSWKQLHEFNLGSVPPQSGEEEKVAAAWNGCVTAIRRRTLALPLWAAGLSCAGWLPGGIFFPLALQVNAGVFGHFLFSFTISGLIALTYSGLAVQWAVLRVLYPRLWVDGSGFRELARQELTSQHSRLRAWQVLAGLIPLAGAALLVTVGPEEFSLGFRLLAIALIALGMAGFGFGLLIGSRIQQALDALVG